jgi:hypothetical protein
MRNMSILITTIAKMVGVSSVDNIVCNKLCLDDRDVHFNIPDAGYKILEYNDVTHMMDSYLSEMSQLLGLSTDVAQAVLQYYKWYAAKHVHQTRQVLNICCRNKERLVDAYYTDPEATLAKANIGRQHGVLTDVHTLNCRICGSVGAPSEFFGLSCNHFFCRFENLSIHSDTFTYSTTSHYQKLLWGVFICAYQRRRLMRAHSLSRVQVHTCRHQGRGTGSLSTGHARQVLCVPHSQFHREVFVHALVPLPRL